MRAAASYPERRRRPLMAVLSLLTLMVLAPVAQAQFKTERPPYPDFLNYGKKKFTKPGIELENEIIKSKVEVLGEILKSHVHQLRQVSLFQISSLSYSYLFSSTIFSSVTLFINLTLLFFS